MQFAVRGVLFDLDGTLVDNMEHHIEAWVETGRTFGRELTRTEIMRDFAGRRNEEIFPLVAGRKLAADDVVRLAAQKEARYRALFAPQLALIDGAAAFMDFLDARGVPFGIASAAPRENRDFVLDGLGIRARMGCVVGAEEVSRGKPAPDLFVEAASRLGIAADGVLVFEDATLGVQAGVAAGMRVCGISTGEPREVLRAAGAFETLPNFVMVPSVLKALFAG